MRRPAVLREKLQAPRHMCRQGVRVMAFRDEPSRPEFVAKKTRALYHKLHDRPKVFAGFSTRSQLDAWPAAIFASLADFTGHCNFGERRCKHHERQPGDDQ